MWESYLFSRVCIYTFLLTHYCLWLNRYCRFLTHDKNRWTEGGGLSTPTMEKAACVIHLKLCREEKNLPHPMFPSNPLALAFVDQGMPDPAQAHRKNMSAGSWIHTKGMKLSYFANSPVQWESRRCRSRDLADQSVGHAHLKNILSCFTSERNQKISSVQPTWFVVPIFVNFPLCIF